MKIVLLYYILYTIIYFGVADGGVYWAVINMLSIFLPLCFLLWYGIIGLRYDAQTKGWLIFSLIVTVARAIYTTAVPHAPYEWIYSTNKTFALIITICLIIKIARTLYKNYLASR